MSTTVTSKGQVTIPKPIRERLGLTAGSQVEFAVSASGEFVLRRADGSVPKYNPSRLREAVGSRPSDMTTDQIMALLRGED